MSLATLFSTLAIASLAGSPFQIGEPVPRLTLPSISDGAPMSLDDFRGRKVMLHVWASW
jgi:peroxiredoxin